MMRNHCTPCQQVKVHCIHSRAVLPVDVPPMIAPVSCLRTGEKETMWEYNLNLPLVQE